MKLYDILRNEGFTAHIDQDGHRTRRTWIKVQSKDSRKFAGVIIEYPHNDQMWPVDYIDIVSLSDTINFLIDGDLILEFNHRHTKINDENPLLTVSYLLLTGDNHLELPAQPVKMHKLIMRSSALLSWHQACESLDLTDSTIINPTFARPNSYVHSLNSTLVHCHFAMDEWIIYIEHQTLERADLTTSSQRALTHANIMGRYMAKDQRIIADHQSVNLSEKGELHPFTLFVAEVYTVGKEGFDLLIVTGNWHGSIEKFEELVIGPDEKWPFIENLEADPHMARQSALEWTHRVRKAYDR